MRARENPRISRAAVFLDRDGTLIDEIPYLHDPSAVRLVPGCVEALALLRRAGFPLVLISNQSGVARGYFTRSDVDAVNQAMATALAEGGVHLDGMYYCPHHLEGRIAELSISCDCRKPEPGLILRACEEMGLDASRSFMVGNSDVDVGAGQAAGCTSLLITGSRDAVSPANWMGSELLAAARWIIERA